MTNEELSRHHLMQAKQILEEAERHLENGAWNLAVRRSQECVELSLKALLRHLGLEVPKVHDVGYILERQRERLSGALIEQLDRILAISRRLREERETSFYGDEIVGVPADKLYTLQDATQSVSDADFVYTLCRDALG